MSDFDFNSIGVLAQAGSPIRLNLWISIMALVGVALFIGVSVLIAQNWQHWSFKRLLVSTGNLVWIAPILLAIGWVGWIVTPYLTTLERDVAYNPADYSFQRYEGESASEFRPLKESSQLDAWVLSGQVDRGDYLEVPVHGSLRESIEEARNYAQREALRVVRLDLFRAYPATQTRGWGLPITFEQVGLAPVENLEVVKDVPLGENLTHDMYRVHLLVQLSDSNRHAIVQSWLPRVQEFRLILVCLIAGMLTLCSAAGAACLRLDLKTEGKFRTWLRLATICVVLASTLATQNILSEYEFRYLSGNSILSV